MFTKRPVLYIRTVFFLMAALLTIAWAAQVHADAQSVQLTIAPNGQVMIRGARIDAITADGVTISTGWGSTSFSWRVELTGSTRFVPGSGSVAARKALKVGDIANITGELDTSRAAPTIVASVFKDTSIYQDSASIGGQIVSVDAANNSVDIINDAGTTTIAITRGTILTKNGNTASFSDLSVGATAHATGSLNLVTRTLSAERLTVAAAQSASAGLGFFGRILAWIEGSRGSLSVRDR